MSIRRSAQPRLVLPPDAFPVDAGTWRRLAVGLRLTPTQVSVAEQVLRGRPDKEIADRLGMAKSTLRTHLGRLLARTGSGDRTELVSRLCAAAELLRGGTRGVITCADGDGDDGTNADFGAAS